MARDGKRSSDDSMMKAEVEKGSAHACYPWLSGWPAAQVGICAVQKVRPPWTRCLG